ncbi:uncharacterized protein LOC135330628 [Dromaius novaehollandiae]|uniref:uncharacterized protein LOC135330628 n=1 Tax=Dromaius novaehollandiae TaxID=8790 RepID=UPI00311D3A98
MGPGRRHRGRAGVARGSALRGCPALANGRGGAGSLRHGGSGGAGTARGTALAGAGTVPLCSLRAPCLLAAGRGDPVHGDLADEGHYLYLDEDGPLEVLAGPARCQDTYRDWISLYCWAPFHAAIAATPEGSRCRWDRIGSIYGELSNCTAVLAEALACPWPSAALDAFFLQIHAEYFSGCAGAGAAPPGGLPPGLAAALAAGLGCLVPLAAALTLSGAGRAVPNRPGSGPAPPRAEPSASRLRAGSGSDPAGPRGGRG